MFIPSTIGGGGTPVEADIHNIPKQPTLFRLVTYYNTQSVKLMWENPTDTLFNNVVIVRKVGSIPETIKDGTTVYTGTDEEYTDTGLTVSSVDDPIKYYYRIFACNEYGQPNTLITNSYLSTIMYDRSEVKTIGDVVSEFVDEHGGIIYTDDSGNKVTIPVMFGRYKTTDTAATTTNLQWVVADRQYMDSDGVVTLLATNSPDNKNFDQPESGNTEDNNRKSYGNNRWLYSNIRQWLNADGAANSWYTQSYEYDSPSNYRNSNGFLHGFTSEEISCIVAKTNKLTVPSVDGGGTETIVDKMWLPSVYEVGLAGTSATYRSEIYPAGEAIFELFTDNASRTWRNVDWWLRTPNASRASNVCRVSSSGELYDVNYSYANGTCGTRPGFYLLSSTPVRWSDELQAWEFVSTEV